MNDPIFVLKLLGESPVTNPDPKYIEKLRDPSYLRSLCQKEVSRFEEYVRTEDPQFQDGLSRFEKLAIEGYLYQKVRGHVDAFHSKDLRSMERKNV